MVGVAVCALRKTYNTGGRRVRALDGVSFQVQAGTFVALIGYSGCGKTTLFRHIAGLEKPDGGEARFFGRERPRLGMMFQEPRLLPWLTVRENLLLALKRSDVEKHEQAAREALVQVGLADCGASYPDQLSGGMAQRAALARALCRRPDLLLMDEPFGALDALTRMQLQNELSAILQRRPMTVFCITHDISEAAALADRVLVMAAGRIVGDRAVPLPRPRKAGRPEFEELKRGLLQAIFNNDNAFGGSR